MDLLKHFDRIFSNKGEFPLFGLFSVDRKTQFRWGDRAKSQAMIKFKWRHIAKLCCVVSVSARLDTSLLNCATRRALWSTCAIFFSVITSSFSDQSETRKPGGVNDMTTCPWTAIRSSKLAPREASGYFFRATMKPFFWAKDSQISQGVKSSSSERCFNWKALTRLTRRAR